jgi:putative oxidoreductase
VQKSRRFLLLGGLLTGVVALLHVAIIVGGPAWYRFFGAGERMAQLAARGSSYPAIVTATIAAILSVWTIYALSGAGVVRRLPFLRLALLLIASIFLARGVLGVPVVLLVDDPYTLQLRDRMTFMIVTSAISTLIGLCYAVGAAGERQQSATDSTLPRTPTRAA